MMPTTRKFREPLFEEVLQEWLENCCTTPKVVRGVAVGWMGVENRVERTSSLRCEENEEVSVDVNFAALETGSNAEVSRFYGDNERRGGSIKMNFGRWLDLFDTLSLLHEDVKKEMQKRTSVSSSNGKRKREGQAAVLQSSHQIWVEMGKEIAERKKSIRSGSDSKYSELFAMEETMEKLFPSPPPHLPDDAPPPPRLQRCNFYLQQEPIQYFNPDRSQSGNLFKSSIRIHVHDIHLQGIDRLCEGRTKMNLWMNTADSVSHTHYDPYHNMLFVLAGKKRVVTAPPRVVALLGGKSFSDVTDPNHCLKSIATESDWCEALREEVLEYELGPGDCLFLPEGWFHEVYSESFTIAINVWFESSFTKGLDVFQHYYARTAMRSILLKHTEKRVEDFLQGKMERLCADDLKHFPGSDWLALVDGVANRKRDVRNESLIVQTKRILRMASYYKKVNHQDTKQRILNSVLLQAYTCDSQAVLKAFLICLEESQTVDGEEIEAMECRSFVMDCLAPWNPVSAEIMTTYVLDKVDESLLDKTFLSLESLERAKQKYLALKGQFIEEAARDVISETLMMKT